MAKNPQQASKVDKKPFGSGDPPTGEGNHPWSLATKIAAGLFATIIAPLIVALILKMVESNSVPAPAQPNAPQAPSEIASATAPPQPSRPALRFAPLFNGKDFSGWSVGKESYWSVDPHNQTLVGDDPEGIRSHEPHWIHTEKGYGDFRLRFEYRFVNPSIGGISVRKFLPGTAKGVSVRIQLIADDHPRGADFPTGNVTAMGAENRQLLGKALLTDCQRPTGEWNRAAIEFRGRHLLMRVNGKLVQDIERQPPDPSASEGLPNPTAPIGLHIISGRMEFRGLQIDELAPGDP